MRAMIAEDSGLLRQMLAELLTRHGVRVAGLAQTKDELLRLVERAPPDIVILDIRLPPEYRDEGLQAAGEIRTARPGVGLLVLSHYAETSYAMDLLSLGPRGVGYLVKDRVQDTDRLLDAIHRVAAGDVVIDPEVVARVLRRPRPVDPLHRLTANERRVLGLMAEGVSKSAIAARLVVSLKTVEKGSPRPRSWTCRRSKAAAGPTTHRPTDHERPAERRSAAASRCSNNLHRQTHAGAQAGLMG